MYDAKEGKKISEDFHMDPNEPEILAMIPTELLACSGRRQSMSVREDSVPDLRGLQVDWLARSQRQVSILVHS